MSHFLFLIPLHRCIIYPGFSLKIKAIGFLFFLEKPDFVSLHLSLSEGLLANYCFVCIPLTHIKNNNNNNSPLEIHFLSAVVCCYTTTLYVSSSPVCHESSCVVLPIDPAPQLCERSLNQPGDPSSLWGKMLKQLSFQHNSLAS